jgi:hypothetical protein
MGFRFRTFRQYRLVLRMDFTTAHHLTLRV